LTERGDVVVVDVDVDLDVDGDVNVNRLFSLHRPPKTNALNLL